MKLLSFPGMFFTLISALVGCSQPPEKYFDAAVLNSNFVSGFADQRLAYELASPSVKLDEKTGGTVAMKRKEIIDSKIDFSEKALDKINALSGNDDDNALLKSSRLMYEFILPIYKKDYQQLADLYDKGAAEERINAELQSIHEKYYQTFDKLYSNLIANGKVYAAKYNIEVNWAR